MPIYNPGSHALRINVYVCMYLSMFLYVYVCVRVYVFYASSYIRSIAECRFHPCSLERLHPSPSSPDASMFMFWVSLVLNLPLRIDQLLTRLGNHALQYRSP